MKTALVFGSSGLVGQQLVQQLIQNNSYQKIKLFVRKKLNIQNPKVEFIETKFDNLEKLSSSIKGDDCFFCIGTTKKKSPEKTYKHIRPHKAVYFLTDPCKATRKIASIPSMLTLK